MKNNNSILFTPFKIGGLEIKNRLVECAMGGTSPIRGGEFNEKTVDFYVERAKGGVGLIVSGASAVEDPFGRGFWLNDCEEIFRGPVKDLMDKLHAYNVKFFLQISAGMGRALSAEQAKNVEGGNKDVVLRASSELPNVWEPDTMHRAMRKDEIEKTIAGAIESAKFAKDAGIDGVEIHAVHEGYLLDQFAIANTNKRSDEYGGSLENRLRFTTEIIKGIKKACGEDYPVSVRYSVVSKMKGFNAGALPGEEYEEFGRDYEESFKVAKILEDAGCDVLNTDNGSYDSWYWAHPPVYMPKACNLDDCIELKKHVGIPVICAGRMDDTEISSRALLNGDIDGIGMARPFLADPQWPNKVREGRLDDIRPCISCHTGCLGRLLMGKSISCALNPAALQEAKYKIEPAEIKKKVLVVGGGIGGMEAARLCAMRGHDVVLCEKTGDLGGTFIAAAALDFKEADKQLIQWYIHELEKLDIEIKLNTEVNDEFLKTIKADCVIIATGAEPIQLPIKIKNDDLIMEVTEYLLGEREPGKEIVVVGGGLSGCEAAYSLANEGKKVRLIEMMDDILQVEGLCAANSNMLRELLAYNNVDVIAGAKLTEVKRDGVLILKGAEEKFIKADTVIMAIGYNPKDLLKGKLGESIESYVVGDAVKVGNLMNVIWGAYDTAMKV